MKLNSDLFELIKTLNKNEKRYFRLYASMQSGSKNYLKLFTAINKLNVYDENELKEKYKQEKFIKHLAYTKNYLYELIIKSLVSYNRERSIDSRIHLMISECKILFNKALYGQYFRAISKAKSFVLKHERFGYYLQLIDMEKVIIKKEELQTVKSEKLYVEAIDALEKLKNMFDYSILGSRVLLNYREYGTSRGGKQDKDIGEITDNPLVKDAGMAVSQRAKESFYRLQELINNTRGDYGKSFAALEMRHKIVIENPDPFRDYIIDFNSDIILSFISTCLNMNRLNDAERYLNIYYTSLTKNTGDKIEFEIFSSYINFQIHLKKGEIKKAVKLIPALKEVLFHYKNKILLDFELGILFNIVKCRILEKNFNAALEAVNELMAHPLLDKRADYEGYSRIINLIIHFELGNYSLLKYLIISVYRYLYKHEKKYKLESVLLDFIRNIPEVKNEEMLRYNFISLKKKLEKLKKDEYEKNAFEYFDFLEWINGKISSKTKNTT